MQNYVQVSPSDIKGLGKVIGKERFLPEGVHIMDRNPDSLNEHRIKVKQKNPYEKRVIQ